VSGGRHHPGAAAALASMLSLAACDLGPDYQRPAATTPPAWREAPVGAAVWPATDWWRGFGSAELDALMARAQQANYDLEAAIARVRQADAQVRIARAALLPTVNFTASAGRERFQQLHEVFNNNLFVLEPTVSYTIDFWGKNRAALASAKASALANVYAQQVVALTVESGVATTYFQILALNDEVRVAQENLAAAEQTLSGIEAQRRAGTATQLDVAEQETVVGQQRATIPPLQQQLAQEIDALAILVGEMPEQMTVQERSMSALTLPPIASGLPADLMARRPDVAQAEAQLVAANANIKVARANFFPNVALTAEGGVESAFLSKLLSPASTIYTVAASATQPIFTGGALTAALDLSKAQYDELVADYQKAAISAFSDVETALAATQKTGEQLTDQQYTVEKAREAYRISQAQYTAGTITLLTVLTTENNLFTAETALVQDRLANLVAMVGLFQALGGGWTESTTTAAVVGG
jgi:outer membrane protein, multidrug efflux system